MRPTPPHRLRTGQSCTVRYWPARAPLPEGAIVIADLADCHHGAHSVVILLPDDPQPQVARAPAR